MAFHLPNNCLLVLTIILILVESSIAATSKVERSIPDDTRNELLSEKSKVERKSNTVKDVVNILENKLLRLDRQKATNKVRAEEKKLEEELSFLEGLDFDLNTQEKELESQLDDNAGYSDQKLNFNRRKRNIPPSNSRHLHTILPNAPNSENRDDMAKAEYSRIYKTPRLRRTWNTTQWENVFRLLRQRIIQKERRHERDQRLFQTLRNRITDAELSHKKQNRNKLMLISDLSEIRKEFKEARKAFNIVKEKYKKAEEDSTKDREKIAFLTKRLKKRNDTITELVEKLKNLEKEISRMGNEASSLRRLKVSLRALLD